MLVWFFLYESAGLSLESVDLMYSDPEVMAWKSSAWAPAGWSSRTKRNAEPLLLAPEPVKKEEELRIYKKYSTTSSTTVGGPASTMGRAQSTTTTSASNAAAVSSFYTHVAAAASVPMGI